jgi:hypothetical protein
MVLTLFNNWPMYRFLAYESKGAPLSPSNDIETQKNTSYLFLHILGKDFPIWYGLPGVIVTNFPAVFLDKDIQVDLVPLPKPLPFFCPYGCLSLGIDRIFYTLATIAIRN